MPATLQVFGKLPEPSVNKANALGVSAARRSTPLLRVRDRLSGHYFLVDTGAERSVFPASTVDRRSAKSDETLEAANGSKITTYGTRAIPLDLGLGRRYTWDFIVADVTQPLLGADFLVNFDILVHLKSKILIDTYTYSNVSAQHFYTTVPEGIREVRQIGEFAAILREFPAITKPHFTSGEVKHDIKHYIPTTGPPFHAKVRRLSPEKLACAKKVFKEMEELGIIRRSNSPWAAPLHMVPKSNQCWRPCGDYRGVNKQTIEDRYPIPNIQDFTAGLAGKTIFSKIDLVKAYNQIPVAEEDIPKTAVITPFGLWEFLRLPYGLNNGAQSFQRFIDRICSKFGFVFVYLDDILVASTSPKEHKHHLRMLFRALEENGLVVNEDKCVFGVSQLEFLGHTVNKDGIQPVRERVQAVEGYPKPKDGKELRTFLGLINYYHRFIPHAAAVLAPLHEILKNEREFPWTSEHDKAFEEAKKALAAATLLSHPSPLEATETRLCVDASDFAVGGVLEQKVGGRWQPLSFFSRKLKLAERKYSTFDRELLAAYLSIKHFRYFVEGRKFHIKTDHKPLTFAVGSVSDKWTPRQTRHLSYIAEFTTDIRHISGKDNSAADAMSRIEINAAAKPIPLNYEQIARDQESDEEVQAYRTAITGLQISNIPLQGSSKTILCDCSKEQPRPILPRQWRKPAFDLIHGLAHPGIRLSKRMMAERFVWHGLHRDVGLWAKTCISCQKAKVQKHTSAALQEFALPKQRFRDIHIDIVGPLPESGGFKNLFTIVDRYTRWTEAIPMKEATAPACARALLSGWISRFGVCDNMTSDRGRQFTSEVWAALSSVLGTEHKRTTSYHPQANGMVERFHRQMKASLKARLNTERWIDELPVVMLGIRAAPKEDIGCSPAELVYGTNIQVPGEFFERPRVNLPHSEFLKQLQDVMKTIRAQPPIHHGRQRTQVPRTLRTSEYVFVRVDAHRGPLELPYTGPHRVLRREEKFFVLDINGRTDSVSIDRLKPAYLDPVNNPMAPQTPPGPLRMERQAPPANQDAQRERPVTRSGRVVQMPQRYGC